MEKEQGIGRVLDMVQVLADKLGQTTEALWPHAVRHTAIEAFAGLVSFIIILVLLWALFVWLYRQDEKNWNTRSDKDSITVLSGMAAVVLTIVLALISPSLIARTMEPIGATVKQILGG